MIDDSNVWIGL